MAGSETFDIRSPDDLISRRLRDLYTGEEHVVADAESHLVRTDDGKEYRAIYCGRTWEWIDS